MSPVAKKGGAVKIGPVDINKKLGPLTYWQWGAVGLGAWFVYKHFIVPGTAQDAAAQDAGAPPGASYIPGFGGGGGGMTGGGGGGGGNPGKHHHKKHHHGGGGQGGGGKDHGNNGGHDNSGNQHHPGMGGGPNRKHRGAGGGINKGGPPGHKRGADGQLKHVHKSENRPPHAGQTKPNTGGSRSAHSSREFLGAGAAGGGGNFGSE